MQYICILLVIMMDRRIATVQERTIAAVRISWKGKNVFRESRNQKREKIAVLQARSLHVKPNLTKTMERLKVRFGSTEG